MSNEETVQQVLNKRNTFAIQTNIAELQERLYKQEQTIIGLQGTLQTMNSRLDSLELITRLQKAMLTGSGPTVKE